MNLSYAHGVFPLVYHTLKTHTELIPEDILSIMKFENMGIAKKNMLMTAELIKVMKLLEENNIEAIAFKGPTLSQMAYGDIALRQYVDLDILIKKESFDITLKLFSKKNYHTKYNYTRAYTKVKDIIPDHMFINKKTNIITEIHNKLFSYNFPIKINNNDFFKNVMYIELGSNQLKTFHPEYLLFYLCLHGTKHLYSRISWILDIDKLIKDKKYDFDWNLFQSLVEKSNSKTMVYIGLYLAKNLFDTEIPEKILKEQNKKHKYLIRYIINTQDDPYEVTDRFTYQNLIMFDSLKNKISYCFYLFKPTVADYQFIPQMDGNNFFYYMLRPFRLLTRYITKIFK